LIEIDFNRLKLKNTAQHQPHRKNHNTNTAPHHIMTNTVLKIAFAPLAAVLLCLTPAAAQQSQNKPQLMDISFSVFSLDTDIEGLKYTRGSSVVSIPAPSSYKPAPVRYAGPIPLVLFRETKDSANKPFRVPLAEVRPPQPTGSYLVVLKRLSPSPERYAVMIVPDEKMNVASRWQFINLTKTNVALVFTPSPSAGEKPSGTPKANAVKQIQIESGKSEVLDLGSSAGYFEGKAYLLTKEKQWTLGYSTRYYFEPRRPRTFFISPDPGTPNHLNMKIIYNAISKPENTSAPARRNGANRR
jgi:hypothetical protein